MAGGVCLFLWGRSLSRAFLCWSVGGDDDDDDGYACCTVVVACACSGVWDLFLVPDLAFLLFSGCCAPSIIPLALGSCLLGIYFIESWMIWVECWVLIMSMVITLRFQVFGVEYTAMRLPAR